MFIVNSYLLAVILCVVTMMCWGSWGNTQKLAGKSWRYELFYWDYVIGIVLFSLLIGFTLGSIGSQGRSFVEDLSQVSCSTFAWIIIGGIIFNLSNILLSASISLAGMSVAFPVGVGLALVLGVIQTYILQAKGNPLLRCGTRGGSHRCQRNSIGPYAEGFYKRKERHHACHHRRCTDVVLLLFRCQRHGPRQL